MAGLKTAASIGGSLLALAIVGLAIVGLGAPDLTLHRAQAQSPAPVAGEARPVMEEHRLLLMAIASAVASVAVDSERNAIALTRAEDQVKVLQDRIARLEARLVALEKRR